jgi:predicted metal-dependent peptidase
MERVSAARETAAATDLDMGKLLAARRLAVEAGPYLATALHAMAIVPTYAVPTMSVDRYWRCYVSPSFVAVNELPDLAFVWLHEVSHLVRDHHGRADALWRRSERHGMAAGTPALDPTRPQREQLRLNLAMDCEVNDDLLPGLFAAATTPTIDPGRPVVPRIPPGAVTPAALRIEKCDLFEQYVRQLTPAALSGRRVWLDCGSGAHGGDCDWEHGEAGADPLGPYEAASIRIQVRDALKSGRGTAPAGWRRWAEGVAEPLQDWRTLLGAALRARIGAAGGAGDHTYRRPGRRTPSLGGKVVLPSLRRPPPQVAVVVDTSGSVSDQDLGSALSEVAGISRAVGVQGNRIAVYSCDAAVHTVQRVCKAEEITLTGGGGTDLRKGIDRAAAAAPRPDVIVVLTDGDTPWPAAAPGSRVVAGIFGSRPALRQDRAWTGPTVPAWAETVYLR